MFGHLVRAEWTKLVSVRRWVLALLSTIGLTVLMGLLASSGGATNANEFSEYITGPENTPVSDEFEFFHQPLTGDGSLTAQVLLQRASHDRAGAGLMVKQSVTSGSPYAAVMVTPGAGVRFSANYSLDLAGSNASTPRWLRITRAGNTVIGSESADAVTWHEVGRVSLKDLPATVEIGLFVSSPPKVIIERQAGSTSVGIAGTNGEATFGGLRGEGAVRDDGFESLSIRHPRPPQEPSSEEPDRPEITPDGTTERNGVFNIRGHGKIGAHAPDDDMVQISLFGILIGLIAVAAVGVLFVTSEYKRSMIRTTFWATPQRGLVLAAKATVLAAVSFAIALAACLLTFLINIPIMRDHGFAPPAFPSPSLADPTVLRAILGTSLFVAAVTVLSLALGAILRRSAAAITTVVCLVVLPAIVSVVLPAPAAKTLMLITPAGGLSAQRAKPPTETLVEPWAMISPWVGLGVALGYAAIALIVALVLVRRRDA